MSTAQIRIHGEHCWLTVEAPSLAEARAAIAAAVCQHGAHLLQERIFTHESGVTASTDGVPPVVLKPLSGTGSAILAHARIGGPAPQVLAIGGRPLARCWKDRDGARMLALSALSEALLGQEPAQEAAAIFAHLAEELARLGSSLRHLARTWIWMERILDWYGPFNQARNQAFAGAGLLGPGGAAYLPASTGIGIGPPAGRIAIEALATLDGERPLMSEAAGNQQSAYRYGSAFSRAVRLRLGGAEHLFVSGTAAIDAAGRTVAIGDPDAQAAHTLANLRAVLRDHGCDDACVVQAMVYAATPEAAAAWRRLAPSWPAALTMADVCRPDLLVEAEVVAAIPG